MERSLNRKSVATGFDFFMSVLALLIGATAHGAPGSEAVGGFEEDLADVVVLPEVVVTGARADSEADRMSAALSVIDWERIRELEPALTVEEPLRRIPGVFVQNSFNFAQDQRIAIRGFGTRAAFGVREVKLLVDGIPESSPDGQTQLDNLDLGSARSIEVLRGPAAALYGNASGGVIQVLTDDGEGEPFAEARALGGSFGLRKYNLRTGGSFGRLDGQLNGSYTQADGYRDHSGVENRFFGGRLRGFIDETSDLSVHFNYADSPWAQDAGGLTRAEVDADRRQARALNVTQDTGEKVSQGRLGLVYRKELAAGHELTVTQYSLFREFLNKLPIVPAAGDGIVEFDRFGVGGGIKYVGDAEPGFGELRTVAGVDAEFQEDGRRRYANVAGARGALGFHQRESVRSVGPFVREEFRPAERLRVVAGARYDNVRFEARDRFLTDGDDSGARTLDRFSWSGGVEFDARTNLQAYANISTAFQTPTTTELANPSGGGGFNPAVDPQTAVNYEIGARFRPTPSVRTELALFLLKLDDELIPFTSASGRDYFRNAGRSERKGAEFGVEVNLVAGLDWRASYTAMDAHYRDYVTAGGAFSGNREPGIPAHQLFTELSWRSDGGFFGSLDFQFVDSFPVDDANTARNDAYSLVNARIGRVWKIGRGALTPFVGFNNLLNQRYNGQTRLNAFGGRYYEPSPRFNVFGGLTWRVEL